MNKRSEYHIVCQTERQNHTPPAKDMLPSTIPFKQLLKTPELEQKTRI